MSPLPSAQGVPSLSVPKAGTYTFFAFRGLQMHTGFFGSQGLARSPQDRLSSLTQLPTSAVRLFTCLEAKSDWSTRPLPQQVGLI